MNHSPSEWFSSYKKAGGKNRRGVPPAPPGIKPLAGACFIFWVGRRSRAVAGLFRDPPTCPDFETFFWEIFQTGFLRTTSEAFPLGGRWPGAAGTDEGATGYPTEQKKAGVQAAGRWALVFYKERLRCHRPLISLLRRQLPPKGKPLDVAGQPPLSRLYETPAPARPAGGRAASHGGYRAAGQSIKISSNPQGISH